MRFEEERGDDKSSELVVEISESDLLRLSVIVKFGCCFGGEGDERWSIEVVDEGWFLNSLCDALSV